jgi:hypothetical protein
MHDIHHRLVMNGSQDEVFSSVTKAVDSLAAEVGALVRTLSFDRDSRIVWRCVDGPEDWIGTEIAIELSEDREGTVVRFVHRNWRTATDGLASCATRWARVLFGLERFMAVPEPNDTMV